MARYPRLLSAGGTRVSRHAWIAAAAVVLLVALVQVNSVVLGGFHEEATELADAEAALVSTELSLRTLSQAVVLAADLELGVADPETAAATREEAERVLADLDRRLIELDTGLASPDAVAVAEATLAALEQGDAASAGKLFSEHAATAYQDLYDSVRMIRDTAKSALDSTQGWAQRFGTAAGIVIVLLLPAAAIYAYWRVARRQLDSAHTEMDAQLHVAHQDVAVQNEAASRNEVASGISRELRAPLDSIRRSSEALITAGLVADNAQGLISDINNESADLSRRVENLLVVTEGVSVRREQFDVAEEVAAAAKPLERAGRAVELACSPSIVSADRLLTRQVIHNLISNVDKWGGPEAYVTVHQRDGFAVIAVGDRGPGIPPDVERHLFAGRTQEGRSLQTAGLGLAAVETIVGGMGGAVRYERDGEWTRFVIDLPLAQGTVGEESPATEQPEVV